MLKLFRGVFFLMMITIIACKKETDNNNKTDPGRRYFEVGITDDMDDWRDTSFVVATSDSGLLAQIAEELTKPIDERRILFGVLIEGNGGYNTNGTHAFKWHFKEDDWELTDMTAEIYSGRPHSDVDLNLDYWLGIKSFGPWNSYIKKEIKK